MMFFCVSLCRTPDWAQYFDDEATDTPPSALDLGSLAGDVGLQLAGLGLWTDKLARMDGFKLEEVRCCGYDVKRVSDSQQKRDHFTSIRWVTAACALVGRASVFGPFSPRARVVACPSFAARTTVA